MVKPLLILPIYIQSLGVYLAEVRILNTKEHLNIHIHITHALIADTSQIFLRDTRVYLNVFVMRNSPDVTGGKPIA
jgi:hypothetical protein